MDFVPEPGLASKPLPAAGHAHPISLNGRWNARLSKAAEALIADVKALLATR